MTLCLHRTEVLVGIQVGMHQTEKSQFKDWMRISRAKSESFGMCKYFFALFVRSGSIQDEIESDRSQDLYKEAVIHCHEVRNSPEKGWSALCKFANINFFVEA